MGMRRNLAAIGFGAVLFSSTAALADGMQETLAGFGLLGQWAQRCGTPPTGDNAYATYAMTSQSEAQLRYDFGPDYQPRIWTIYFARRVDSAPDELRIDAMPARRYAYGNGPADARQRHQEHFFGRKRRHRENQGWRDDAQRQASAVAGAVSLTAA